MPDYNTAPSRLNKELIVLRKEYRKHQIRLSRYYDRQPVDVATVDEQMLLRECRDKHGCCTVNNVLHMEGVVGVLVAAVRNLWHCIFRLLKRLGGRTRTGTRPGKEP